MDYEIRANKYSFAAIWRGLVIILFVLLLNEMGIFILDNSLMRKGVFCVSILWIFTIVVVELVGFEKKWMKYFLTISLVTGIYILYIFISYHLLLLLGLPFIVAAQYSSKKLTLLIYIYSLILLLVTMALNYEFGLCDMNMVGLTYSTAKSYGKYAIIPIEPLSWHIYGELLLYYGTTRAAVLTFYVFVANAIVRNASDMMQLQTKTEEEGKRDVMTGLMNKNEYLRAIKEDYGDKAHVGVIYIDVNDLKVINDKFGHDKGDELIINLAKSIVYMTEDDVEGYRVGGDEFVIIMENASGARLTTFIARWLDVLHSINTELSPEHKVVAAYGYSYGKGSDLEQIIEEADNNMYACKKQMKSEGRI